MARPLKIIFLTRPGLARWPGGDTVQILQTARALRAHAVTVDVTDDPDADLRAYDCVHLWHLERVHETYVYLLAARRARKPVALSPVYWPSTGQAHPPAAVSRRARPDEELKNIVRWLIAGNSPERRAVSCALRRGWAKCRSDLLHAAAVILPNSRAEARIIARECPGEKKIVVVPNAIDLDACDAALAHPPAGPRQAVLSAGHFDPRKNQLGLIAALRDTDVAVTFIGAARRLHRRYYRRCVRQSRGKHQFPGLLPHEEVLRRMGQARVHVCPSHFETPGLASLEAAVLGCAVVVPDCPPVREYFGVDAFYLRGHDPASIRLAVDQAFAAGPNAALAARIRAEFTWDAAARQTRLAYDQIVA